MLLSILPRRLDGLRCSSEFYIFIFLITKGGSMKNFSINVEVNSHLIKAFVDSGAQSTISEFALLVLKFLDSHISFYLTRSEP